MEKIVSAVLFLLFVQAAVTLGVLLVIGSKPTGLRRTIVADDDALSRRIQPVEEFPTSKGPEEFPRDSKLLITNHYLCDTGPHCGKYYVKLEGYVTYELLQSLMEGL